MSSLFYFILTFVIFDNKKINCYGIRIFPNHEIEVQFDIAQPKVDASEESRNFYNPKPVLRANDNATKKSKATTTTESTTTTDGNTIVYMKDLKKAFEDLEKKLKVTVNCNHQISAKSVTINYGTTDRKNVDIFKILKESAQSQNGFEKPKDEDISWVKIRVPT